MRILIVCGAGMVSGKEIITLSLIEGLHARGHEVRCVTSTWASKEFIHRLEASQTPYEQIPMGFISKTLLWSPLKMSIGQMWKLPRLWSAYRAILRAFRPDVVVQTNFHHTILLWPVLDARNTLFHVHDPFLQTGFYRRVFKLLNRRLCAFVGVSEFIRKMIVRLGVPEEKTFFVLNGINVRDQKDENVRAQTAASSSTETPGKMNGAVKISIVGQIGEWKGHDDFIEALKMLKQSNLAFSGVIYGSGDATYAASLKEKIAAYHLTEQIRWAGFIKDNREIFAATDICVVPSRSEDPCPTVAIEAAHFGVPLIATRRGGLPELVLDGETGYLVDAGAPEQITAKLRLLIEDVSLRHRMAQAARQHSLQHLTEQRMVEQMETLFERVPQMKGIDR
jgi:glycosyltransferase involved in cell wall biosynthesis